MCVCVCWCFQVEEALEAVKNATNEQDLANRFKEFGKEMVKLNYVAARRQQVLLNITFVFFLLLFFLIMNLRTSWILYSVYILFL